MCNCNSGCGGTPMWYGGCNNGWCNSGCGGCGWGNWGNCNVGCSPCAYQVWRPWCCGYACQNVWF